MPEYKKIGYLNSRFKMFHIKDSERKKFSFHYHDFHKILILLGGDVTYCIEGRSYDLLSGDIVLVNAGEVHRPIIRSDVPYERIIMYISPDFLDSYTEEGNDLTLCLKQAAALQSHVLRLAPAARTKLDSTVRSLDISLKDTEYASELFHRVLFLEFMIHLNRAALQSQVEFIPESVTNEKISAVLSYLDGHFKEDISIDDLASEFYMSRYYLMHAFKAQTGYTIGGYLSSKRLLLARELIAGGMPITEACYACGFKNYSTFSRAYKKDFGGAPSELLKSV